MKEGFSPKPIEPQKTKENKDLETTLNIHLENRYQISKYFGVNSKLINKIADKYRKTNPEYFVHGKNQRNRTLEYFTTELVEIIKKEIKKLPKVSEGSKNSNKLAVELKTNPSLINKIADKYRKTNPEYFEKDEISKIPREYYTSKLVNIISKEAENILKLSEGSKSNYALSKDLNTTEDAIKIIADKYRKTNPEYFMNSIDPNIPHSRVHVRYTQDLVKIIKNEIGNVNRPSEGSENAFQLMQELKVGYYFVNKIADKYRKTNPEYFEKSRDINKKNQNLERFTLNLVNIIKKEAELNLEIIKAPQGWKTNNSLCSELGLKYYKIQKIADKYRKTNPEYFKVYKLSKNDKQNVCEHYSPKLVEIITKESVDIKKIKIKETREEKLKEDFENFVEEIGNEETKDETAKKIADLLKLLPGKAHDIIIRYHPQYKGLKAEYVEKIIADYLGDILVNNDTWQPRDAIKFKEVMNIDGIKEGILINMKDDCLAFVNSKKMNNRDASESDLIEEYFKSEQILALVSSGIPEVDIVLKELRQYYKNISNFREKKPGNIIETLREGRTFPDINQLVNIEEIREKKKMLIADDMGLGKSASAILAKEYMGLTCALVVVPNNVEDTWKNYLSDKVNENGKQVGYFKNGLSPKVLVIESPKDLERLNTEVFDYVMISQEKISSTHYGDTLKNTDFDMMIVDEIHKLKNIDSGVRSKAIEELSEKIQGENKYLALLSGTPVPNKVKDIGITLKLLYPEKYKEYDSTEMVKRILYGDLVNLRSELLQRMQMKELTSSIEMPPLTKLDVPVDLVPAEREIYDILLEEDELTALDKIVLFRQFLLNPEILKVEPGFIGSKVKQLSETLHEDLKTQNKIVVFINGYVEGVIRGKQNIIDKMNLPSDIVMEEIHGEINQLERKRIESELKTSNMKTIVWVSGQTADVGVDFSGAEGIIHYNEPWSNFEKAQQLARVYREGLEKPLTAKTLITKNSIEEGIRSYNNAKEKAILKLLKGIGNTNAEKKLLSNDSKLANSNIETNVELSKEYLSDWEKLMMHFGQGFQAGEKVFRKELPEKGKEYANLYKKLGRLTYQGNNARVTATILKNMMHEKGQTKEQLRILDIASGPEMLKTASSGDIKESIFSTDINAEHFIDSADPSKTISASYLNIPSRDNSTDYVNLGFAFHQTSKINVIKKNYERLQVLAEMNRVLKPGGRAIISMIHNVKLVNKSAFNELVGKLGFKIVPEYSGEAKGGPHYKADFITLEKVNNIEEYKSDALKFDSADNAAYIRGLGDKLGRELLSGLEMQKISKGSSRLRDQRRMVNTVTINGKEIELNLNDKDRDLYTKEIQTIQDGEELRAKYHGIKNIPIEEIKSIGFERKLETPGYYLLYKIIEDGGAVIIRGDYRSKK